MPDSFPAEMENAVAAYADADESGQRLDLFPLRVGQIARVAQHVAVVTGAVFRCPHNGTSRIGAMHGITADSLNSMAIFRQNRNRFK
jgi:hypothetical protein